MVDLGGYVIILVETNDKRVKLYGSPADKADLEVKDEVSPKKAYSGVGQSFYVQ